MAKTKRQTGSELEHLRGKNKELASENRHLKKQIKKLEKSQHIYDSSSSDEDAELEEYAAALFESTVKQRVPCLECARGYYEEFAIMDKVIGTCTVCSDRRKLSGPV